MLTCDDASQHKVINTALYYIYTITYAIAKYWPQSVKQAPKMCAVHRNDRAIKFQLRVADSTQLECTRLVIIQ